MNPVLKTTYFVIKNSKKVKINKEKILKFTKKLIKEQFKIPKWPEREHFLTNDVNKVLTYLIILDSLNFCFWPKKWKVKYYGKLYSGYFALSITLKKFFEFYKNINFEFLKNLDFGEFKKFFKDAPLVEKRYKILKDVSSFMNKKYKEPVKFILAAQKSAKILLKKIYKEIPHFYDATFYQNKKIYFLKRAQILIADIYGAFNGKGIGYFQDIDYLTCFPDYKLPQILYNYGILEYTKDLENKIKKKKLIKRGSLEEVEIRANTVWAVEYLKESLKKLGKKLNSFEIDWYLWNKAEKTKLKFPHHLTITIYY